MLKLQFDNEVKYDVQYDWLWKGEEFELEVKAVKFLVNNVCEYPTKTVDLRLYSCDYISGEFKLHDHSEIAWVNKNKLLTYELAPADIPLAKYVEAISK